MKVVVSLEQRFDRTPDGAVWAPGVHAYAFCRRYLAVFDHTTVVARVRDVPSVPPEYTRCDGEAVTFLPVPYFVGAWGYLKVWNRVVRVAQHAVGEDDAVIMRVPSTIAACIYPALRQRAQPYGVEAVGDPYDVFGPGAMGHPLRPYLRWRFSRDMRRQCGTACAAAYVTQEALQKRYPCAGYSVGVSDVDLPAEAFVVAPRTRVLPGPTGTPSRREATSKHEITLVSVGSLEHLFKGPDVLIEAIGRLVRDGMNLRLAWVGDGRRRRDLEAQCRRLGLDQRVTFRGHLTAGQAVRAELDRADLFVLASRLEGLPRAMLEAMARGLACLGSAAGGIPELLAPEDMVSPGDARALARKIREVVTNPSRMAHMSARNLERAGEYREEFLRERRIAFYGHVRTRTEAWLRARGGRCRPVPKHQAA